MFLVFLSPYPSDIVNYYQHHYYLYYYRYSCPLDPLFVIHL